MSSGAITRLTMAITLIRMFIEGPEVSLKGSPTVSPTTTAWCGSEPLPPWCPFSNILLGVVPCPSGVGHREREQHAAEQGAAQHPAQRFRADTEPDHPRCGDRDDTREDHLAQRRSGGDVDATLGVGLGRAFEQTGDLAELAANLVDHLERRLADRIHRQRAEIERDHPADEDPDEHVRGC